MKRYFKPLIINERNFAEEVLDSTLTVIVDFWADWCPPCRLMGAVVDEMAADFAGQLKFAKIDVDACAELAARYEIKSVPTLLVFRDGQVVDRVVGLVTKPVLESRLRQAMKAA